MHSIEPFEVLLQSAANPTRSFPTSKAGEHMMRQCSMFKATVRLTGVDIAEEDVAEDPKA